MHPTNKKDRLRRLKVPPSNVGAPSPQLIANSHQLFLAYYIEDSPKNSGHAKSTTRSARRTKLPVALIEFDAPYAHYFGPPREDASRGHPLHSRGFRPHSAFEVLYSSWIRFLKHMNEADFEYDPKRLNGHRHFIFAFHDDTFECIARKFTVSTHRDTITNIISKVRE